MARTLSLTLKEENMEFIVSLLGTIALGYIFFKLGKWLVTHFMSVMGCLGALLLLPIFLLFLYLIF
jgi:hypothetical protein